MIKKILFTLLLGISTMGCQAANANSTQAKELFYKIYNSVFGQQGSSFSYKVNIIGLYKTKGSIIYKGKKRHFSDEKVTVWEDGTTAYIADRKAKEIRIYSADDEHKDKWMSKFKFDLKEFDYSYTEKKGYYYITAKVRNSSLFGIRHVTVKVLKSSLCPVSLTIKLALIRTTIQISGFRSGNISDNNFIFPRNQFKGYKFTDYRNT